MKDYYALFGVPAPKEGENVQEPAEPVGVSEESGENVQEPAEPAREETQEPESNGPETQEGGQAENGENAENGSDDSEGEGKPQSAEERRRQAAARKERETQKRQNELQAAIERERQKAKEEKNALVADVMKLVGMKTKSGEPVQTLEQYEQLMTEQKQARLERDLKAGKLSVEGLQQAIAGMPQVREALENAKKAEERANSETFTARREMELAEIRKINPEIQSLDDILKMETGKKFAEAVGKGNSFIDAYFLANREDMLRKQREAGRQAARNEASGKSHMQATSQEARGSVPVTDRDRKLYRLFNPEMTDAEIAKAKEKANQ